MLHDHKKLKLNKILKFIWSERVLLIKIFMAAACG